MYNLFAACLLASPLILMYLLIIQQYLHKIQQQTDFLEERERREEVGSKETTYLDLLLTKNNNILSNSFIKNQSQF